MCNPVAIIGAIAAVAGGAMQYSAAKDREKDLKGLQRRETDRQNKLYNEAAVNLKKSQDSYQSGTFQEKMDMAAGEREAQYAKANAAAPRINDPLGGSTSSGNVNITDAFSRALTGGMDQATQQGALRAELASFGDQLGTTNRENNRRTGDIGMIGSFSRGSSNVLPIELQHAATKERSKATIGSVLQAVGMAMMGGAGGAGAGAAGGAAGGAGAGVAGAAGAGAATGAGAGAASAAGFSFPWASIMSGASGATNSYFR